jgi:hypothetical protein
MASSINPVVPGDSNFEEHHAIKVVIAYEDVPAGQRAMSTCKRLFEQLGQDFEFQTILWKFEVLRVSQLKRLAAQDAAEADLVIIATHGQRGLAAEIKDWIESWLGQKGEGDRALVALLGGAEERAKGRLQARRYLQDYLQEAAQKANVDFFSHTFADLDPGRKSSANANSARAKAGSAVWRETPGTNHSGWGINE